MSKVYLPTFTGSNCVVIKDKDTIRVYDNLPVFDTYVNYTDYFINSNYMSKRGEEFIETVPLCENQSNFTSDFYYRNDFDKILVIFLIVGLVCIVLPLKIVSRAFGRWLKL